MAEERALSTQGGDVLIVPVVNALASAEGRVPSLVCQRGWSGRMERRDRREGGREKAQREKRRERREKERRAEGNREEGVQESRGRPRPGM